MFLCDETRIINTALVQQFGFTSFDRGYFCEPSFANGSVIAAFKKDDGVYEVLYEGSGEACLKFYLNLLQALVRGDRMVAIKDLHPEASD